MPARTTGSTRSPISRSPTNAPVARKQEEEMIEVDCHCGAVRMEIDAAPQTVTDCNCSICRRLGTLWAYYSPAQVRLIPSSGATSIYMWDDRSIEFNSYNNCGCTTHWS